MKNFAKAVLLALLVLLLAACAGGDDSGADGDGGGADAALTVAAEGEVAASDEGGGARQAVQQLPGVGLRIVKTASLRISVGKGGFESAVDEARSVASGLGGFVVSSSAGQAGRGRLVRGSLVIRVPGRSYEQAVRELRRVGRLERMSDDAQDVSSEFVDLEARRRHLEAVERQLLSLLDRAKTVPSALAVQSQLNETQLQLEQARGRLGFLEDQTTYATISVTLGERGATAAPGDGGWGIVDAWGDGARAFTTVTGKVFVVAAGAAPILFLLGLAWLAARYLRRRIAFPWGASRS
ncbi:MAG: DUF4349 domain-containing protein [Actinobacteria bacterium]|nr:DUF4349 domain-containing protein [Actinomycetota bacterium]